MCRASACGYPDHTAHLPSLSRTEPLSFSHRKEYVVWIVEAKKPETRAARLTKTVEMLARGKKNPSDK